MGLFRKDTVLDEMKKEHDEFLDFVALQSLGYNAWLNCQKSAVDHDLGAVHILAGWRA